MSSSNILQVSETSWAAQVAKRKATVFCCLCNMYQMYQFITCHSCVLQYCNLRKTRPSSTKKALTMCLWRASGLLSTNLPLLAGRSSHLRWTKNKWTPAKVEKFDTLPDTRKLFFTRDVKKSPPKYRPKASKTSVLQVGSDYRSDCTVKSAELRHSSADAIGFWEGALVTPCRWVKFGCHTEKNICYPKWCGKKNKVVWRPPRSITSSTCSLLASLSGLRHWYLMFFSRYWDYE